MRSAPRVRPGDRLSARLWNDLASVVDGTRRAPRDLESDGALNAADVDAPADITLTEQARASTTVRVTNPEDENQYVDVERATFSTLQSSDGTRWAIDWRD